MIDYTNKGLKVRIGMVERPVEAVVKTGRSEARQIRWVRNMKIEATLLDRDISTIVMASFVKAQIHSFLHKKLGEIRKVNSGFGSIEDGFLCFDLSERDGVKFLKVSRSQDGVDREIEYYNYAQVFQMSVVVDKLIQSITAECKIAS